MGKEGGMSMFFTRSRLYQSEKGRSKLVHEIMPDKVTLNKDYGDIHKGFQRGNKTPFAGVELVPCLETLSPELIEASGRITRERIWPDEFARGAFDLFKEGIYKAWDSSRFHVVLHSSGHDSRMVSWAIKELTEAHGFDWLGDVLFFELNWETEQFHKIMDAEGWGRDRRYVYNEGAEPGDVHEYSFNFSDAWERLNAGTIGYPINTNYDCIKWLQEKGMAPLDVQVLTGHGGSEIARSFHNGEEISTFIQNMYRYALMGYPLRGENIHAFYYLPFMQYVRKYGQEHINRRSIADAILDHVAPDLSPIRRVTVPELVEKGCQNISRKLLQRAVDAYRGSQYYKDLGIMVSPSTTLNYSDWWGHYNLASYYERLREEGRI
ncbi:MAG TPA: hypothetical protein PLN56_09385 [Methanoregulaceae archaeon]|nr:hypothetical protein [Methanoregulaceae archaeon]